MLPTIYVFVCSAAGSGPAMCARIEHSTRRKFIFAGSSHIHPFHLFLLFLFIFARLWWAQNVIRYVLHEQRCQRPFLSVLVPSAWPFFSTKFVCLCVSTG